MRTRNLSLLTLLVFLLTSCMPDSFTKFKEDPPTKKAASGGTSGEVATPTPTATPTATPTPSDVVYEVEKVEFYQSKGDTYIFLVNDGTGFDVGDTVNISTSLFFSNTATYNYVGTITNINTNGDDGDSRILGVKLDGTPEVGGAPIDFDYDGNFAGFDANYASDAAIGYTFIASGYYIDNCSTGYGTCALGTASTTTIAEDPVLYISPNIPLTSPFPNATLKNLSKRVRVLGTRVLSDAKDLTWEYEFSPSFLGLGVKDDGAADAVASDGSSDNDRLVSPFGPFTLASGINLAAADSSPMTVTAKLAATDYGTQLDPEEQGSGTLTFATTIPGDPVQDVQEYELSYYLEAGQRFAVKVANVSGFVAGLALGTPRNVVRACKVTIGTGCDEDNETVQILGKATIDYIDADRNVLYLTAMDFDHDGDATADHPSIFREGLFLHNGVSTGGSGLSTFVSDQTTHAARIFLDTTAGATISPEFNIPNAVETTDDDPSNTLVYSVDTIPDSGFSLNPSTGVITITNPSLAFNKFVTVTATDTTTGGVLDTFILNLNFLGQPIGVTYDGNTSPALTNKSVKIEIGNSDETSVSVVEDSNSVLDSLVDTGDDVVPLNFVDYQFTATPPTGVTITNQDDGSAKILFAPSTFVAGGTPYTVEAFFPAYDPSAAFASSTIDFYSATPFSQVFYPQGTNDLLILTVGAVTPFSTSSPNNRVSNRDGATGTVLFIDSGKKQIYVRVDGNYSGEQVFKAGDELDNTSSFIVSRTEIGATNTSVVHVFTTNDANDRFDAPNGLVPALFDETGASVSLAGGETVTFAITPNPPSDITFDSTDGSFTAVVDNSLSNSDPTVYTIAATNNVGSLKLFDYAFTIAETPSLASVGRYQFVRLSGNTNKFYRGSRIESRNEIQGRVLMTIDIDGDGTNDGLLLENNGDLPDGEDIDNTSKYFASEARVEPYHFWYVKDTTGFTTGTVTTDDGASSATIIDIDTTNNRIYAKINNGSFDAGDIISDGSDTTIINSVEDRHYVTGVIEVNNSAAFTAFDIGGPISTNNGGTAGQGIVVQKHIDTNYTSTAGDERYYLLIQHISGVFAEGDSIDDAYTFSSAVGTIDHVVGPNLDVTIPGGSGFGSNGSISGRVDRNGNPLFEGSLIGAFSDTSSAYQSAGFAVYGTDYANNIIRVQVEDFYNHFEAGAGSDFYLDDFTISNATIRGTSHTEISGVKLSNLMIGYVDEPLRIEPTVKGEFTSVSLSPETLPAGLTFDSSTGTISGTPTEPMSGLSYTISFNSALNIGSPATYTFDLVIYNQFEVFHETENASSYLTHREGQGFAGSRCKVITPQVIDDVSDPNYNQAIYGMNDIVCLFEGGESDLFNRGIEWAAKAGSGMCEYIQYTPFSYSAWPVKSTDRTIIKYNTFDEAGQCNTGETGPNILNGTAVTDGLVTNNVATIATGIPIAGRQFDRSYCEAGSADCNTDDEVEEICTYNYGLVDPIYPNVDQGSYTVKEVSCTFSESIPDADDPPNGIPEETTCTCNYTETVVNCGGSSTNGLAGAKRATLDVNEVSEITTAVQGATYNTTITSPISKGYGSNRYIANFHASRAFTATAANSCYESKYTMESYSAVGTLSTNRAQWEGYDLRTDPMGYSSGSLYSNFYTFDCLDASFNPKARIRVLVRDWDREFTPETEEVESLVGISHDPTPTITIGSGSHTATLSAGLNANHFIGRGSIIFVEDGTTVGFQPDEDIRFEVASYGGGTTLILKTLPTQNLGPVAFYIRSKIKDDSQTGCFGESCDSKFDMDSRSLQLGLSNAYTPAYGFCGDNTLTAGQNEIDGMGADTITLTGGELNATVSGALSDTLAVGSIIVIDLDGDEVIDADEPIFPVLSGSGTSITLGAAPHLNGAYEYIIVRRLPFSLETPD